MADSNLGCGSATVKYLVFIFNIVFFLSGLALICVGGVAQGFFGKYIEFFDSQYNTPAIGLIILGVIILVISFFGCCGAKQENVCMLRTFSFLMGGVLICEVAAGIAIAILRNDVEGVVKINMKKSMTKYGPESDLVTKTWDDLQQKYDCCGTLNYTDWKAVNYSDTGVPDSCCRTMTHGCGNDTLSDHPEKVIFTEGCYKSLEDSALGNLGTILGFAVGLALIQMFGIWMSCCLITAVKERYEIL